MSALVEPPNPGKDSLTLPLFQESHVDQWFRNAMRIVLAFIQRVFVAALGVGILLVRRKSRR